MDVPKDRKEWIKIDFLFNKHDILKQNNYIISMTPEHLING